MSSDRRPLSATLMSVPGADPQAVRAFITQERPTSSSGPSVSKSQSHSTGTSSSARPTTVSASTSGNHEPTRSRLTPVGLIPVTVRLRPEIAGALKRASLERQLNGEVVFTQQALVELALEPWLRAEGYLP